MLVLSRKPGEQLVIGDDIRITVVATQGSRVTLGIDAPPHNTILRGELVDRVDEPIIIEIPLNPEPTYHPSAERSLL
jgi:carbon storage regulator CsrA